MTEQRRSSFGEGYRLTLIDRFGTWLSSRKLRSVLERPDGAVLADIGCGYDARFGISLLGRLSRLVAIDVSLSEVVRSDHRITAITGGLPNALATVGTATVDYAVLNSVLEHLDEPISTLSELRRIVRPETGVVFVNVPTWLGKIALETSAFRFKLSPPLEIEDHRRYYSARQLWQSLRDAGFLPSEITVRRHKFGLNVYAICRVRAVTSSN